MEYTGQGNGRLDAVSNAIQTRQRTAISPCCTYKEHALETGSTSHAVAYVGPGRGPTEQPAWGAGQHTDIMVASVKALASAINNHKRRQCDRRRESHGNDNDAEDSGRARRAGLTW